MQEVNLKKQALHIGLIRILVPQTEAALQPSRAEDAIIYILREVLIQTLDYFGYIGHLQRAESIANAYSFDMAFNLNTVIKSDYSKTDGGSVRCIKDAN